MARRSRLTDVGHVALDSLGELGAGRNEEWLSDAAVHAAIHHHHHHHHHLAFADGYLVVVVRWEETSNVRRTRSVNIRPSLSDAEGEISAIEWVAVGDLVVLALGTSAGYLLFYSLGNVLLHKQIVHNGPVLRLRFREVEDESESDDTHVQEFCVVMPGVIARFDGSDIKSCLDQSIKENSPHGWGNQKTDEVVGSSLVKIPYRVWNVSKFGSCADAVITGLMPPPLLELQSEQRHYCAVTVGNDSVISAYRVSEHRSRSLVGAILRKALPAAVSTIASFSKLIWQSEKTSVKKPEGVSQSFDRSSPLTCLKDHPRKGEKLTLSPSGTLAAITDSLGRILLLDTRALVVVRLWKGYRDACCLFMEMLVGKDKGKSTSSSHGHEYKKGHYCLCLVIHAPRKGIIEVWKMRTGPRVFTIQCPKGSKILQPSSRRVSSTDTSSYIPLEVFILNGVSGRLSVLNRSIG